MKFLPESPFQLCLVLCIGAVFGSCNQERNVPFPENPSGYEIPKPLPFELPQAEPIAWKVFPKDSTPNGVEYQIDVESLPYKRFSANEFRPLKTPIHSIPFDWENLETQPVNFDTVKGQSIPVKKFLLPAPIVTSASVPSVWQGGNSAIVRLGQTEGLLGNKVYAMATDPFGSMWISTDRGLTKYDGTEFLTYNFFGRAENGSIEVIAELLFDPQGRLLISGVVTGVYRLDITLGLVEHFQTEKGFIRMDYDAQGKLWAVNQELFRLDLDQRQIFKMKIQSQAGGSVAFGIKKDRNGNLWIGLGQGIGILDSTQKTIRFIGVTEGLVVRTTYEFLEDSQGTMWMAAFSPESYSVNLKNHTVNHLGPDQGFFGRTSDMVLDGEKRIWLISEDTVRILDPKSSLMKKVVTGAVTRDNNNPSSTIVGKDGMIWLGTDKVGVLLMNPKGMLSDYFTVEDGLQSNDVWGINEDSKGRIWLGTYQGVNIYDPKKERLYLFQFPGGPQVNNFRQITSIGEDIFFLGMAGGFSIIDLNSNSATLYNTRNTLGITTTLSGEKTRDGKIWIGTSSGMLVFDPEANTFKKFGSSEGLSSDFAFVVKKDSKGQIWVNTDSGIHLIDPEGESHQLFNMSTGLMTDYNSMVFETSQEEIIIGGDMGISIFNPKDQTITHVSEKSGVSPPTLYDLNENMGRIQIGSENGIIVVERPEKNSPNPLWRFTNFGKSSGLPYNDHNQATSFVSSTGEVWWGAAPILLLNHQDPQIDSVPPTVHIKGMNIMDQNPDFLKPSFYQSHLSEEDTLWLSDFSKGWTKAQLPADSSYLSQNKIKWDSISPGFRLPIGLKLPYNQNSFNFTFSNQSTLGRDKVVYRYILEGADEEWSEVSPRPSSRIYYNLQPGDYTFKVATRGFNGVWSVPVSFEFVILPPWWQTWWAYLLFASLFGGVTYAIVYVRSQWLKKENRILEEKVAHRTSQLNKTIEELKTTQSQLIQSEKMASLGELTAGIAHEIQNPLNFVNNFSDMNIELIGEMEEELEQGNLEEVKSLAKDIKGNEQKIMHHGKRADSIVKGMLMHSRSNTGQRELTDLNALADEYLRLSYHGIRAKDKSFNANFTTDFDPTLPKVKVITQDLGRVFLNLINNAFYAVSSKKQQLELSDPDLAKSFKPQVTVSSRLLENQAEIRISDNGSGIPESIRSKIFQPFFTTKPTGQGTGLGLSLSYDIVKAHGGEIQVESQEGKGTTFIVSIPLH